MELSPFHVTNSVACQGVIKNGMKTMQLSAQSRPSGYLAVLLLNFEDYENTGCTIENLPSTEVSFISLDDIPWHPEADGSFEGEHIFETFTPNNQDCFFIVPVDNTNSTHLAYSLREQAANNLPQMFTCFSRNLTANPMILAPVPATNSVICRGVIMNGIKIMQLSAQSRPNGCLAVFLLKSKDYDNADCTIEHQPNTKVCHINLDNITWYLVEGGGFIGEYIFETFAPNDQDCFLIASIDNTNPISLEDIFNEQGEVNIPRMFISHGAI